MIERALEVEAPVHDLIARRRSPRAFDSNRPVPRSAILSLLEAARLPPPSFNEQPWRFLVFDGEDPAFLEQARGCLADGNAWARAAPVLLLSVSADRWVRDGTPNRHAQHDVGLASESLAIQATAMGLGVHFMAGFDAGRARSLFGIPEGFTPMAMIAVGYPGHPDQLPQRLRERELAPRRRKAISEIAFAARWGSPLA